MTGEAIEASLRDADALEQHAAGVLRRGRRNARVGLACMLLAAGVGLALGAEAATAPDGTYEGLLKANWAMLGVVVALGALNFAWGWRDSGRRLQVTARRLLQRAEYQRKIARARMTENP